jgi:Flp pilus assembly protein protease CpaA
MQEYFFLWGLAFLYLVFASIQDLKTTEVSNWLNFSLIGFGLGYRAFYSLVFGEAEFFILGLMGLGVFVGFAYGLYYSKAFGGGDSKLLMGVGTLLPYSSYWDLLFLSVGFVFLLLVIGVFYTLVWSVFLVGKNFKGFKKEFKKIFRKNLILEGIFVLIVLVLFILLGQGFILLVLILFLFLILYLQAVDKSCMTKGKDPKNLMEGDWLVEDIKLKKGMIKKNVHGLSSEEIIKLRKEGKKVLIKAGIPFVPNFLITFTVTVLFLEELEVLVFSLFF